MPSGKFETKYKEELRQVTLLRILTIVIFLDKAKMNNVIDSSPRLFNKNATIKSSKEFLAILCRDYLYGIGSVFKQLALLGISVEHEQTCMDELDFSITNLATDLRDGVVLGKLVECLEGSTQHSVLSKMRLPVVSRLQKVHNVRIALSSLSSLDIADMETVQPNHIVDGHRPQVLKLLWSIISSFSLSSLLCTRRLREEIHAVIRANRLRCNHKIHHVSVEHSHDCDDVCLLLLFWCKAVCSYYNHDVDNFSKSFADGKTISYLIHYYHPSMINLNSLLPTRTDAESVTLDDQEIKRYVMNERKNSEFVQRKVFDIGGIPMCPLADSSDIPDTRSTITCVSYLCARLLESSREILAAIVIQKSFRKYWNKEMHEGYQLPQSCIDHYFKNPVLSPEVDLSDNANHFEDEISDLKKSSSFCNDTNYACGEGARDDISDKQVSDVHIQSWSLENFSCFNHLLNLIRNSLRHHQMN